MEPLLGVLVLLFIGMSTACLVYLHFLPTGYHPLHNAVSEYGVGKYHFWYQAMCVNQAIAAFLLAAALAITVKPAPAETDAGLIVLGLARLVISQTPVYEDNHKRTKTTKTHLLMAFLIFGSAVVASASFSRAIAGNDDWASIATALHILRWAIAIFALATFVAIIARQWAKYVGAVERLLYISIIGWFVAVSIYFL